MKLMRSVLTSLLFCSFVILANSNPLTIGSNAPSAGLAQNSATIVANQADAQSGYSGNVYKWTDVPQNQDIPIVRETFDRGGYLLYDSQGDTIVVPFTNNNLYVMQFAISPNGTTYFVNSNGNVPVFYTPRSGYFANASVSGARWYPFPNGYQPNGAVYLGIAPNWNAFVGMGWYPNMYYRGGYWGQQSYGNGGMYEVTPGLYVQIGGQNYNGWSGYQNYYQRNPGYRQTTVVYRTIYTTVNRPNRTPPVWRGATLPRRGNSVDTTVNHTWNPKVQQPRRGNSVDTTVNHPARPVVHQQPSYTTPRTANHTWNPQVQQARPAQPVRTPVNRAWNPQVQQPRRANSVQRTVNHPATPQMQRPVQTWQGANPGNSAVRRPAVRPTTQRTNNTVQRSPGNRN